MGSSAILRRSRSAVTFRSQVLQAYGERSNEFHREKPRRRIAELVGCSHGWVALFNRRNNDLFISNPITRRHMKLPAIHTLPDQLFLALRFVQLMNPIVGVYPDIDGVC
ncbi:hypothetical protein C2S51_037392 [Perilla frutescens var. frutescens]|nr:hypothetical protein C2S51_037392 [Perilla frutescens var. frutescens]